MNQDQIQDAIEDVKTWIGRSPASIDERYYERKAGEAFDSLVEEIERLKGESQKNFMAFTQEAMISGVKCEFRDQSLQSQIATLTAERDEARKDLEQVRVQCAACLTAAEGHTPTPPLKQGDWAWTPAYQQTWELRQKYDALKSAPAMAEVDALRLEIFEWLRVVKRNLPPSQRLEVDSRELTDSIGRLADIARRSISSREEVVGKLSNIEGLLVWMVKHWDWTGKLEGIADGCVIEPWKNNVCRILEIVKGNNA